MRLAIALYASVLLAGGWANDNRIVTETGFSKEDEKVVPTGQAWLAKTQSSVSTGLDYFRTGMGYAKTGLGYAKTGFNLATTHLGSAQKALNAYYTNFMDAHGESISAVLSSASQGLADSVMLISKKMGPLLLDLKKTVLNVIWYKRHKVFPAARRGPTPFFASFEQFLKVREQGTIKPISVKRLNETTFETVDNETKIMLAQDPTPHVDEGTGIARLIFTSNEKPPGAYVVVNIENSGLGNEAFELESYKKAIVLYFLSTSIEGNEELVTIEAGPQITKDVAPQNSVSGEEQSISSRQNQPTEDKTKALKDKKNSNVATTTIQSSSKTPRVKRTTVVPSKQKETLQGKSKAVKRKGEQSASGKVKKVETGDKLGTTSRSRKKRHSGVGSGHDANIKTAPLRKGRRKDDEKGSEKSGKKMPPNKVSNGSDQPALLRDKPKTLTKDINLSKTKQETPRKKLQTRKRDQKPVAQTTEKKLGGQVGQQPRVAKKNR